MLVFGGLTYRNKSFGDNSTLVFEDCENEELKLFWNATSGQIEKYTDIPDYYKSCGEELLNDIWRYHVKRNMWSYIKVDYNKDLYSEYTAPSARYGHSAS